MRRTLTRAVLVPLLLVLGAGCGTGDVEGAGASAPAAPSSASVPAATVGPAGRSTDGATPRPDAAGDDLGTGRARHEIRSSGVTATVDYETRKPDAAWTATGDKPLRVEVRVSRPSKKVYLNRVTLRFSVDDGSGLNPGPEPLVDTSSNIVPGFLVAPPYSYVQSFAVPEVDPATLAMTIDVKLEFVSLVDAKSKDYTKQTITDRLSTQIG